MEFSYKKHHEIPRKELASNMRNADLELFICATRVTTFHLANTKSPLAQFLQNLPGLLVLQQGRKICNNINISQKLRQLQEKIHFCCDSRNRLHSDQYRCNDILSVPNYQILSICMFSAVSVYKKYMFVIYGWSFFVQKKHMRSQVNFLHFSISNLP